MKQGWEKVYLSDISVNLDSKRIPITKGVRTGGLYPYYGASGIVDYVSDYIFDDDLLLISEDGANLLARSTPIAFSVSGKIWVNNHAHILKFENKITQRYIERYFESIKIDDFVTGAAQPKLNQKALNSIPIIIPKDIPEQERIVGILDSAFAKIEALRANAQQNLQNTKDLFLASLKQELTPKQGWIRERFEDVIKLTSGDYLSSKDMITGRYPVYGGNNIAGYHNEYNLDKENVIIGRVGALCGNARYILQKIWLTDNAFKISVKKHDFNYPYLAYLLNFTNLRQYARQTAQPVISNSSLKDVTVLIPPMIEQQAIVEKLDALSERCRAMEENYSQTIAHCNALKQALLTKAFNGEL